MSAQGLERVCSGEGNLDVDLRLLDDRHEIQRQQKHRHRAQYRQAEQQHQRRNGSIEGNVGQAHSAFPNSEF
jgi:hypothetical protein